MLVELHCHTTHSKQNKVLFEGLNSPKEVVGHAKRLGVSALAITDHDTIKGHKEATIYAKKHGIVFMPGVEVSSKDGHILAFGVNEVIKPGLSAEETIDLIHDQGAIAVAPHPFDLWGKGIKHKARLCDAVESFNAINVDRIGNRKAKKFAEKHKMAMTAGSDAHCLAMMGHGLIKIQQADSYDDVLKAIKKGRTELVKRYMPSKVIMDWSVVRLQLSRDYIINYIDANYNLPKRVVARNALRLVNRYPGRINYLFRGIAYFSLGSAIVYSATKEVMGVR